MWHYDSLELSRRDGEITSFNARCNGLTICVQKLLEIVTPYQTGYGKKQMFRNMPALAQSTAGAKDPASSLSGVLVGC